MRCAAFILACAPVWADGRCAPAVRPAPLAPAAVSSQTPGRGVAQGSPASPQPRRATARARALLPAPRARTCGAVCGVARVARARGDLTRARQNKRAARVLTTHCGTPTSRPAKNVENLTKDAHPRLVATAPWRPSVSRGPFARVLAGADRRASGRAIDRWRAVCRAACHVMHRAERLHFRAHGARHSGYRAACREARDLRSSRIRTPTRTPRKQKEKLAGGGRQQVASLPCYHGLAGRMLGVEHPCQLHRRTVARVGARKAPRG